MVKTYNPGLMMLLNHIKFTSTKFADFSVHELGKEMSRRSKMSSRHSSVVLFFFLCMSWTVCLPCTVHFACQHKLQSFICSFNETEPKLHPKKVCGCVWVERGDGKEGWWRCCFYPLLELIWRSVICCKSAFSLTLAQAKRGGKELGTVLRDWTWRLKMKIAI